MFAEELANGMQVPFKVVRMENQQAGSGLVGSADFWSNSKSGAVFSVLTENDYGNPILVIDELDKATNDGRYNPVNGLYSLLEPSSARAFSDESLPDVTIDASKVTWIMTANSKDTIPEPILSRLLVFAIPSPTKQQSAKVARRIYQSILDQSFRLKVKFSANLADEVIDTISSQSPRKMRLLIETALGKAAITKRRNLVIEDFDLKEKVSKINMGFI